MASNDRPDPTAPDLSDVKGSIVRAFEEAKAKGEPAAHAPQGPPPDAARLMAAAFHRVVENMAVSRQASTFASWRGRRRKTSRP